MAKLNYNEIVTKSVITLDGEPYVVLSHHVFRKQQRKPVNVTKLKGLVSGRVVERTFHMNETADEAELSTRPIVFVFQNQKTGEYTFHEADDRSARFSLPAEVVGDAGKFLAEGSEVSARIFDEEIIGVQIPIKVELTVTEAADAVKGNTSSGATKEVVLETGARIQVPQFINQGDVVRVNTETGAYAERVEKA